MNKNRWIHILKIAVGSSLAIILAKFIGLQYSSSAGIITLLSIQNTKKETLRVAAKRLLSFWVAVGLGAIVFQLLGYHPVAFGAFLFLFIAICYLLQLQEGIAMCSVLITHFLSEKSMSLFWLKNEMLLLLIGVSIGILLNLYMPTMIKLIRNNQLKIEEDMKRILKRMSEFLLKPSKEEYNDRCFEPLEARIEESIQNAYENGNNSFRKDARYFIQYLEMRRNQSVILKRIYDHITILNEVPQQAYQISELLLHTSKTFHEHNNVRELLLEVEELKRSYKEQELPRNREEFENRALLLQILFDLEDFLKLKKKFIEEISEKQIKEYWK